MKSATSWKMKMTLVEDCVSTGEPFSKQAKKARDITNMMIFCDTFNKLPMTSIGLDRAEFDDLLASKKDSAPGLDGIPSGIYRFAGGLGSKFLFHAYQAVLEGRNVPTCFAERRTVFIPKTSDTDDLGRIVRSPNALRPLTLCNCNCKILTSAICRGLHLFTPLRHASLLGK